MAAMTSMIRYCVTVEHEKPLVPIGHIVHAPPERLKFIGHDVLTSAAAVALGPPTCGPVHAEVLEACDQPYVQ